MVGALAIVAIVIWVYMSCWFGMALQKKRNDLADVAWGLGFVAVVWIGWMLGGQKIEVVVANLMVTAWGTRLSWHVYLRNKDKSEDYRYASWRKEWGKNFIWRSYIQVFLLQGLFMFLIAMPTVAINWYGGVDKTGVLVWLVGFYFEVVGDWQLKTFLKDPTNKGKIMDKGWWRYSRHPNYFGEITMWWGIWLMGWRYGWWTIIGPLTITILIRYVSGVPLLEKKFEGRKDWEEYKQKTSVLIPWPFQSSFRRVRL